MDASLGLVMLVGKYLFLGLLYVFLYWGFRGLFERMAEDIGPRQAATAAAAPAAQPATAGVSAGAAPAAAPGSGQDAPAARQVAAPLVPTAATLVVQEAGQSDLKAGQIIPLTAAVTIGRAEDNGLVVHDKFCSQHHAMIFLQHGRRLLRDRNSTNGTYHNGQRLIQDVVLQSGDRITVGTVTFEYRAAC